MHIRPHFIDIFKSFEGKSKRITILPWLYVKETAIRKYIPRLCSCLSVK